jgi:capsular polysaccharide biosynthesis protein
VFDLLWPLFRWIRQAEIDPRARIYLRRRGFFMDWLDGLLEPSIRIVRTPLPRLWARREVVVGMNPAVCSFRPEQAQELREYLFRRLGIERGPRDGVLLIERIQPDGYFLKFYRSRKGAGATRRVILNHRALAEQLAQLFGQQFRNVALEELEFREQVQLFRNARLVIGQHGAGLANVLWMEPGGQVVELAHKPKKHFVNLCRDNRLQYHRFDLTAEKAHVDVEALLLFLRSNVLQSQGL